ncbi:hypothetical protein ES319_D06G124400v1 [Gossypium barbadense]|uniref:Uncharacterized protein n=2 Tax=Gossypium TaxID=3633 RepID=A0A5J5R0Z2_GOSBA|nr:hypothetical protein ES319_D06G124400v1 [Gossypium barbadense]
MRPMPMELVTDPDDQGSAMEVDDVDTPEIFDEGIITSDNKLAYADFFNNFETESVESVESIPPQPPSSSQALVSATFSPSVLSLKSVRRSALFGAHSTTLQRSRCCEFLYPRSRTLKRACSASLVDDFSDEEF